MSNSALVFDLLTSCQDEGEMEYILNAAADYGISNPKLGLSAGSGRVNAVKADIKHAGCKYNLFRTSKGVSILVNPLKRLIKEIPRAIEYRTQRLINPQLPEEALTTEIGILRMGMIAKCYLGAWVDPEQEKFFHNHTRKQRLASYKANLILN